MIDLNRKKHRNFVIISVVLIALTAWLASGYLVRKKEPNQEALRAGIIEATAYLDTACDSSGRFAYRIHLDKELRIGREYNMLRHAGSIYSMCMAQEVNPTDANRDAILRAINYMRTTSLSPVEGNDSILAVWTLPHITGYPLKAKLGGAGLGLIAMASTESLFPGTVPLEEMQGLARFIQFMQRENGAFNSYYYADQGPDTTSTSQYYPGEAALGLILLYELDGNTEWLEIALNGIGYLANERDGAWLVEPDHWSLLATARLWPHYDQIENPRYTREDLLNHTQQIVSTILIWKSWYRAIHFTPPGCFVAWGAITPTATRMEGLLAALTYLPEDEDRSLRMYTRKAVGEGAGFLLSAQIKNGPYKGAMPHSAKKLWFYLPIQKIGKRNARVHEVRIDYVQHSLSAMVRLYQLK